VGSTLLLKIIILQLIFGMLARRSTRIFGVVAGERCSFEIRSYLIVLYEYFS